jgi:predicted nucleotidyltransferase
MLGGWRGQLRTSPDAEVYVIGGVDEGRVTVLSDIGVLVAIPGRTLSSEERRGSPSASY